MEDNVKISIKSKVIYLAEDDLDDVLLFEGALSNLSPTSRLVSFTNGQKLLDALENGFGGKPDIVFLDINMPLMNGLEALHHIRSKVSKDLPVFVLSTAEDYFTVEKARELGATGYLSKPAMVSDLVELLSGVLTIDWEKRKSNDYYIQLHFQRQLPQIELG